MHRLVSEIGSGVEHGGHLVALAAFSHHALVAIHPFADGNGRVARLLGSVPLLRTASIPLMVWADQSVPYRAALEAADAGDPQPFVDFVFDRAIDAMNLMADRLATAAAEGQIVRGAHRRTAEERQFAAAERLLGQLERALRTASPNARDGVATTWDQTDVAWAGSGPVPYADARRLTMVAVDERRSRQFTLLLPRDRLDAVDIATDRPGSVRRFRVSDLDPELTTSTSLQIEAFVAAQAAELAAELLG